MIKKDTYRWYAIRTKFKCEKHVVEHLLHNDIKAYVPLLSKRRKYTRKVVDVQLPLIHCYAFVFISKAEYTQVLSTMHVVGFVKSGTRIEPIPTQEMELMQRVVGEKMQIDIRPTEWMAGDSVEIIGGSLTGIAGKLVRRQGKKEFVVDLETIGFQVSMIIEEHLLRPRLKKSA